MSKKIAAIILILCISLSAFHISAAAIDLANETETANSDVTTRPINRSYESLFTNAFQADGAISEQIAAELVTEFNKDAWGLVSAMAKCIPDVAKKVAYLLAYGESYFSLDDFKTTIIDMVAITKVETDANVLKLILGEIEKFQLQIGIDLSDALPIKPAMFDTETILHFIEMNEITGNVDEEFFHTIGNAYKSDPEIFAKMLSTRSSTSIAYIARAIAYDCINSGDYEQVVNDTEESVNAIAKGPAKDVLKIIEAAIADKSNGYLDAFFNESILKTSGQPSIKSTQIPSIGTILYSTNPLYVGDSVNLSVSLSESTSIPSTREYWVEVYCVKVVIY